MRVQCPGSHALSPPKDGESPQNRNHESSLSSPISPSCEARARGERSLDSRVAMGGVCFRGQGKEENAKFARYEAPRFAQQPPVQPQEQQRPRPQPQATRTSEQERAQSDEARANAAIAAQKRLEAFEKSAGGKAAKKAIAAAKAPPPSRDNRDDVAKDWAS